MPTVGEPIGVFDEPQHPGARVKGEHGTVWQRHLVDTHGNYAWRQVKNDGWEYNWHGLYHYFGPLFLVED